MASQIKHANLISIYNDNDRLKQENVKFQGEIVKLRDILRKVMQERDDAIKILAAEKVVACEK